ncbi:MAG TPA: GAF and ANTAR domain-containing protein [Arthrobacter sp.]|nr:GAF and ANTAR domain-containing protein [Arthrobacter sp.]
MAGNNALTAADEYQDLLLESPGFPEFLLGLATISASRLRTDGSTLECSITVERDGAPSTVACSSEEGHRLDETQYALDAGPCLTALRGQRTVLVNDFPGDGRWGQYLEVIARDDVHSVLAVPIATAAASKAALNCYAHTMHAFDPGTVARIEDHAGSMSRILRLALRLHAPEVFPDGLRAALQSRALVDAAVSLVMLQTRGGRDDALDLLHLAATSSNRRIQEIAREIVDGGQLSAPPLGRQG